ncbi:NmrA family NAD(P)-binding protein [Streptomyces sp. NPDC092952]|uniref:NmrA family NAD(P)-binding protein n=1 Tax=Streptomyces sp. NPDC092952 TaxID=3366018 RepID=UPI00380A1967
MQIVHTPRIVVLGATGLTGGRVAAHLADAPVEVVRASRNPSTVRRWKDEGRSAVHLDLDDPRTFPAALEGADRLFLATPYSGAMTHQSKTVVDAASDAGVQHIVHLGIFGDGRATDPHFAWHELVERYIEGSGVAWTHLHPHTFMEVLLTTSRIVDDCVTWPVGDKPMGFVANEDLAAVAAQVLAEGPGRHAGKGYWLSTDVVDGPSMAAILSEALGRPIAAKVVTPEAAEQAPAFMDPAYAASILEYLRQNHDGRMDFSQVVTSTVADLLGRDPIHLGDWAKTHRRELLAA